MSIRPCLDDPLPLRLVKRGKVLGRHAELHRPRLPGLQPDLVERHEDLDRRVRRPLRLAGIDLHDGPAGNGSGVGHVHRDLKLITRHVGGFPGNPEPGEVKGRVREAVAERKVQYLLSDPVIVPVPDEHALGVLDPELAGVGVPLAGEVAMRRRVLDARREADGQLPLRTHGAGEHVGDGVAALLAGEPRLGEGGDVGEPRHGDGDAGGVDDDGVPVGRRHRGDQAVLVARQVEGLLVAALGLPLRVVAGEDDGDVGLGRDAGRLAAQVGVAVRGEGEAHAHAGAALEDLEADARGRLAVHAQAVRPPRDEGVPDLGLVGRQEERAHRIRAVALLLEDDLVVDPDLRRPDARAGQVVRARLRGREVADDVQRLPHGLLRSQRRVGRARIPVERRHRAVVGGAGRDRGVVVEVAKHAAEARLPVEADDGADGGLFLGDGRQETLLVSALGVGKGYVVVVVVVPPKGRVKRVPRRQPVVRVDARAAAAVGEPVLGVADQRDGLAPDLVPGQGQDAAVVLEEHDSPGAGVPDQGAVLGPVDGPLDGDGRVPEAVELLGPLEDGAHAVVNGGLGDVAALHGVQDGGRLADARGARHLDVHAGVDALGHGVGAAPVAHDEAVPPPLAAEDVPEQPGVRVAVLAVDEVVDLAQGALRDGLVDGGAGRLLLVGDKVLDGGRDAQRLAPPDHLRGQLAGEEGVLAVALKVAPAERVAVDAHRRREQAARALGLGLLGQRPADAAGHLAVKGGRDAAGRREAGRLGAAVDGGAAGAVGAVGGLGVLV
ncbi:hypothetical protein CTA1_5253 [Colletotrichum tanaceti]|uniref:Uncharacterized protein n=1 Tax=Colletotrichum tanaceti TaxID=1306861 RepID=A0A4U6XMY4_9PEZI|nr:hypothetical protein CTA1_5253 [Colletotrichum tanaceti]